MALSRHASVRKPSSPVATLISKSGRMEHARSSTCVWAPPRSARVTRYRIRGLPLLRSVAEELLSVLVSLALSQFILLLLRGVHGLSVLNETVYLCHADGNHSVLGAIAIEGR